MIGNVQVKVGPRSDADDIKDARAITADIERFGACYSVSLLADLIRSLANRLEAADARMKAQQAQYRALEKELEARS